MKRGAVLLIVVLLLAGCGSSDVSKNMTTPENALARLTRGNEEFSKHSKNTADYSRETRWELSSQAKPPLAVVLTCSDARVVPEYIFNAGLGEIFVIRTAGNVVTNAELGSIEYGVLHAHAPLIIVMGHTGCRAVEATINNENDGNIKYIINEIEPSMKAAREMEGNLLENTENLNIENSVNKIFKSEIVQGLLATGKLKVIGAKYNLIDGRVDFNILSQN